MHIRKSNFKIKGWITTKFLFFSFLLRYLQKERKKKFCKKMQIRNQLNYLQEGEEKEKK